MISSNVKIVFDDGMLHEMKRYYLKVPHREPELFRKLREWVYTYHVTEVRFGTSGGTTLNGQYYPSTIYFGSEELYLIFALSYPEFA